MRNWFGYLFIGLVLLGCSSGKAKKEAPLAMQGFILGDSTKGKLIYNSTCKTCHGNLGEGNKQLKSPALANTDAWYLFRQLRNFQKGYRGYSEKDTLGLQMAAMAKTLKDSIAVQDVVTYIKTKPEIKLSVDLKGDWRVGENNYQSVCGSCHGPAGKGNEKLNAPRLNGLNEWYLKSQINKFKNSLRGTHPHDKFGAQMVPMVTLLHNEQEVNDVVAYILYQPSSK